MNRLYDNVWKIHELQPKLTRNSSKTKKKKKKKDKKTVLLYIIAESLYT